MPTDFDLSGCKTLPPLPAPSTTIHPGGRPADTPAAFGPGRPSAGSAGRWAEFNNFVDVSMRTLKPSAKAVWFVLFRDARGGVARASKKWIAERAGVGVRTVYDAIEELTAAGLVEKIRQGYVGGGTNVYRVRALPPAPGP